MKRTTAFLIMLCMVICLFAGCGGKTEAPATTAAPMGWEMSKELWQTLRGEEVEISLPPEALLLLKDKNSEVMK